MAPCLSERLWIKKTVLSFSLVLKDDLRERLNMKTKTTMMVHVADLERGPGRLSNEVSPFFIEIRKAYEYE